MFKDKQDYEKYIEKQKVTNADLREENYFEHNDNGEIIIHQHLMLKNILTVLIGFY